MSNTYDVDTLIDVLNIPKIDKNVKFWMIRTKQGVFYDEFIANEYIAIGWNYLSQNSLKDISKTQNEQLKESIKSIYSEKMPQNSINKCKRFIFEINEGDYIAVVGNKCVTFAIVGEYYEETGTQYTVDQELEINKDIENNSKVQHLCPYSKRRKIKTIKEVYADRLSPYLLNNFISNHHSLSSLDDKSDLVLSSCYDLYIKDNRLVGTFRVQKKSDIGTLEYSTFLYHTSKLLTSSSIKPENVSVKTHLHSPGEIIISCVEFVRDNILVFVLIYFSIFGGKFKNFEFNSLIGYIEKFLNWRLAKKEKELEIRAKELDNEAKEIDIETKKLDNKLKRLELDEKIKEQLKTAYKEISTSSAALEIKNIDDNIISFDQALETLDTPADKK